MRGKKRGYNLKGKWWHPLVIEELYPYPHKTLRDTLLLLLQGQERTAGCTSGCSQARQPHLHGEAEMSRSRGGHDHTAGWPASRSRATRGSPAAGRQLRPWVLAARLGWVKGCWFARRQEENSQWGLRSWQWGPAADTACVRHPWEAREALMRQCHVNHTGHFSFHQFSKTWEVHVVAVNNIMMVLCGSEGQKGWSALEQGLPSPFLPASATDSFCLQSHSLSPWDPSRPLHKPGPETFHIN